MAKFISVAFLIVTFSQSSSFAQDLKKVLPGMYEGSKLGEPAEGTPCQVQITLVHKDLQGQYYFEITAINDKTEMSYMAQTQALQESFDHSVTNGTGHAYTETINGDRTFFVGDWDKTSANLTFVNSLLHSAAVEYVKGNSFLALSTENLMCSYLKKIR